MDFQAVRVGHCTFWLEDDCASKPGHKAETVFSEQVRRPTRTPALMSLCLCPHQRGPGSTLLNVAFASPEQSPMTKEAGCFWSALPLVKSQWREIGRSDNESCLVSQSNSRHIFPAANQGRALGLARLSLKRATSTLTFVRRDSPEPLVLAPGDLSKTALPRCHIGYDPRGCCPSFKFLPPFPPMGFHSHMVFSVP